MKSSVTTPILVNVNGANKSVAYLQFKDDGSIYLYFPRKKGYKIAKDKEIDALSPGDNKVVLNTYSKTAGTPYLSYHPGKDIIHANFQPDGRYKLDSPVLNISEGNDHFCFPLCQIVIPDFTTFDDFKKSKYDSPLTITSRAEDPDSCLSIGIWIHTRGMYLDVNDLPLHQEVSAKTKLINSMRFDSPKLKNLTSTIVLREVEKSVAQDAKRGIIVAVFNSNMPYIFELLAL